MLVRFKEYAAKLERLSNQELDRSAEQLVFAEKRNLAKVIAHVAEMSRRKAALQLGYKSLFDYCVLRLHLSEGSVASRIHVANVSIRFPQVLVALSENRLSLTVAGLLAPHLSEDNVDKLLSDCAGMTKNAVREYVVALAPKPVFAPSIRKRPEPKQERKVTPTPSAPLHEKTTPQRPPPTSSLNILEPARVDEFNFRFSADRDFKDKFERLAGVLGVRNAQKHMAEIIEKALDIALEKKDPKKKLERRQARQKQSRPDEIVENAKKDEPAKSRYIPSEVVERVHARAGHRCEYTGPDGTRCTSRTGLHIDHMRPFAIFLDHDERWLRLLCAAHNGLEAGRVYGADFIQRKIDERRARRAG
ncbi:MAG: hypothetical protein BMS9Abin37_2886 [Acidobacteriota bacterium]|nr:MAG: hypothetical protein BMS9Abin37_2886 [Acidobacteriota bacterium]